MTTFQFAVASVTVFIGSTLQGSVGFGMGLLASPILILIDTRFVPAPILLSTFILTTFLGLRERQAIDLPGVKWAIGGRLPGTVLAAMILTVLPEDQMATLFGILVLLGVAISVSGVTVEARPVTLVVAGMLSGIMGTIASIGGPPIALVYQHAKGPRLRATMSTFFWIGTTLSLFALWWVDRFGPDEVWLTLLMLPALMLGVAASRWTTRLVDRGHTRTTVLIVAATAGLVVIARQIMGT